MYIYKSTCRSKMLVWFNGEILEIYPRQVIKFNTLINYPYLKLQNPPVVKTESSIKIKPKRKEVETKYDNNCQT